MGFLRDWIKGSVTAIEAGILSFEAVFMPFMLTSDGRPLLERAVELLPRPEEKVVMCGAFAATRKAAHYGELAAMANRFGVPLLLVRAAWTVLAFGSEQDVRAILNGDYGIGACVNRLRLEGKVRHEVA